MIDQIASPGYLTPADPATPILPATVTPNALFGVGTPGNTAIQTSALGHVVAPAFTATAAPHHFAAQPAAPPIQPAQMAQLSDDDTDEVLSLSFTRGDDVKEYLIDVQDNAQASSSGNTAPVPAKLIAIATRGCGRKERKLISGGRWKQSLTHAEQQLVGAPGEGSKQWGLFEKAFKNTFPSTSQAEYAEELIQVKQSAPYAEWMPEYRALYFDANKAELKMDTTDIGQILHFINATPSGWEKRIRRKYPGLTPIKEELMDLFHANEKAERKEPLAAYLAKAEEIETKLLPKIAKMNKDLIKSKRIQFYGTHDEAQPSQAINLIQEDYVTKVELLNMMEKNKTELRNETQATIQSAVTSVRAEIVGDVKEMFTSLTKKMDSDKEEAKQQQQQQRYPQQNDRFSRSGGFPRNNSRYESNSRFQDRFQPRGQQGYAAAPPRQPYAHRRAGGNREHPPGSGNRPCFICEQPGHSFMDCSKFHDPAFAAKKEAAFKMLRRGVNHIEAEVDSSDADTVRESFDPEGQQDDQMILNIAADTLDHMEESSEQFSVNLPYYTAGEQPVPGKRLTQLAVEVASVEQAKAPEQSQGEQNKPNGHDNAPGKGTATVTATDTVTATAATAMVISETPDGSTVEAPDGSTGSTKQWSKEAREFNRLWNGSPEEETENCDCCAVSVSQSDSQSDTEANTPLQQNSEVLKATTSEANSESTAVAGGSGTEQLAQLLVPSSNSKAHSSARDNKATAGNSWQELRVELARRSAIGEQQELMPSLIWQLKEAAEKHQQTTNEVKAESDSEHAESPIAGAKPEPTAQLIKSMAAITSTAGVLMSMISWMPAVQISPVASSGIILVLIAVMCAAGAVMHGLYRKVEQDLGTDGTDPETEEHRLSSAQRKKLRDKRRETLRTRREHAQTTAKNNRAKEEKLFAEEVHTNELQQPSSQWRPRAGVPRSSLSRWAGGCRRKLYRQQRVRSAQPNDDKTTSIMMLLVAILQSGDTMCEMVALSAAAITIVTTMSMMICSTIATMKDSSSSLRKWSANTKSLLHLIPSTSACWISMPQWSAVAAPAVGGIIAATVCYFAIAAWGAAYTTTASVAVAEASAVAWNNHWHGIYQNSRLRAKYTAAYVYLDTKIPSGTIRRKYLLDLGAAASVIPLSAFSEVCMSLNLAPSEARLRGASGHGMKVEGEGELEFLLPGTEKGVKHDLQVTSDGAMPEGLRILGIDFWHSLNSNVDMASRTVTGTTPDGEHFKLNFHVNRDSEGLPINYITASQSICGSENVAGKHDMILADTIQVHPGQALQVQMVLPDSIAVEVTCSRWKWWTEPKKVVLWEPTQYNIVVDDNADMFNDQHGATCITPTGASILSSDKVGDENIIKQFVYLPPEVKESIFLPAGTVLGTVSAVELARLDDPLVKAIIEEGEQKKVDWQTEADLTRRKAKLLQQEVYSIMSQESERKGESKQTTIRHEPQVSLPSHDIRGAKSGTELVQIWEKLISSNGAVREQFTTWIKGGPGAGIEFGPKLTSKELRELQVLCFVFKDIFSINPKAPPEIKNIEHALYFKTNNPKPHRRPLPKLSLKELEHMDKELTGMLANHIIQHSDSEWATLPVFAKKKDGTLRTAIDYRGLNAQILGDNFSVPNIGEVLESLIDAKRFSCYDCSSGFWGLRLRAEDRHYTAFHGYYKGAWNLFEWLRMPFGLKAATATYQRMQQKIMGPLVKPGECKCDTETGCDQCRGLLNRIVKVFVDDGCVYSNVEEDHVNDLARVFCRLAANQVSLKPVKCLFGADQILLLGHEVTASLGIRPDPSKCAAILDMERPNTVDALHNFVGATGWVSKFIPEYAELVKPLRNIIHSYDKKSKASIQHEWNKPESGEVANRAFETLRLSLASRPCLAFPDSKRPFIIITDASKIAIGAVICQLDEDGQLRPVAYGSTPLKAGDKSLGISAKEGMALCWAINRWRHLIYGTTCICLTDHSALQALVNPLKEFDTERMARMALTLSEHDLVIAHRPGTSKELLIADMLSRAKSANDPAKLASLTEQAWGCIGRLCTDTRLHLSKEVMSEKSQQRRIQHMVDGAELREMVRNKEVKTVQEMVKLIESGERGLATKQCAAETLPNRFDDMYEMITAISEQTEGATKLVTDADVGAAQAVDLYCKQMRKILEGKETRVAGAELYAQCKWQAPYHTIAEDGLLRRLIWKPGSKATQQVQEGRAPAVVPDGAVWLQLRLCKQLHNESGHASYLKAHGMLAERYIWAGMSAQMVEVAKTCNQCDYFGDKSPKAPVTGHVTATEPAQRIMMDVVHMREAEGYRYALTLIDVFSRWAMAIPLQNIKSKTVTDALRRHAIPGGMGRAHEFLLDGGSEFKGHLQEACTAWGSNWRPHTPHHSESAGAIERFNKTLELRVGHFAKQGNCNWVDALPLATEAYNGSVHAGLSSKGTAFSPAELWLGRKIRFNSDVRQTLHHRPTEAQDYGEWLRQHTQAVKDWIAAADAEYRKTLTKAGAQGTLRTLQVGDTASVRIQDLEKRDKNAGAEDWDGPWEVIETGNLETNGYTATDYLVKRMGSRRKPKWEHIDNMKQTHKSKADEQLLEEVDQDNIMQEASQSATNYEVEEIVGERGKSRRTKHFLVKYAGYEDAWWQPAKNLYCTSRVQAWDALPAEAKAAKTAMASVANPQDINLIMDLSVGKQTRMAELILEVCEKIGIDRSRLRAVLASPMCNTFTGLDHVNRERGHHFREPFLPYPPREPDGTLESVAKRKIAQEHDAMTENLLRSIMKDRIEGYDYDFCIENPRGLLRHRPYMVSDDWMECSSRCTMDYCVFDHDYQKPTDFWHSFATDWQPAGCTGDGKCHQKCGKGRIKANGRFQHWKRHAGPAGSGVTGTDQMLQKWQIPHKLCAEVVQQLRPREGKDVVLDLFSGGESYRAAVEAAGYIYVPVDIATVSKETPKELLVRLHKGGSGKEEQE